MRLLRKRRKVITSEPSKSGMKFVHIPLGDIEVVVYIDASFAINLDQSSQLGYLVLFRDAKSQETKLITLILTKANGSASPSWLQNFLLLSMGTTHARQSTRL